MDWSRYKNSFSNGNVQNHKDSSTITSTYVRYNTVHPSCFTFIRIKYCKVSWIDLCLALVEVVYSCLASVHLSCTLNNTCSVQCRIKNLTMRIRAAPSRLLLLFKGLAAPSPLKQKEKRFWVRLRPSHQHTSSKTRGEKTRGSFNRKHTRSHWGLFTLWVHVNVPADPLDWTVSCGIWAEKKGVFHSPFWRMSGTPWEQRCKRDSSFTCCCQCVFRRRDSTSEEKQDEMKRRRANLPQLLLGGGQAEVSSVRVLTRTSQPH